MICLEIRSGPTILCVHDGRTRNKVISLKITVSQVTVERARIIFQVDHAALVVVVIAAILGSVAKAVVKTMVMSEAATTVEAAEGRQQEAAAEADKADAIGLMLEVDLCFCFSIIS